MKELSERTAEIKAKAEAFESGVKPVPKAEVKVEAKAEVKVEKPEAKAEKPVKKKEK